MIQRVVFIKLKREYANDADRAAIVAETRAVLPQAHGVRRLEVGVAADARSKREWDIGLVLQLDSLEEVERYRVDRVHRAYVDVFLKPMVESIRVWNYELGSLD